ncbi:hypothetical protein J1N35_044844 [Gossypium stocksii]|uniref:Uncharacterized protein n=1 Tax=Gossypium stocksii TaxID=47602 RepID=A0A9D3UA57_9ROSI|nr:hypothetical protein J1N35_044844 [Gossypium stocksii]
MTFSLKRGSLLDAGFEKEPQCLDHALLLCPYAPSVWSAVGYSHGYAKVVELIVVLFDSTEFKKLQRSLFLLWMIRGGSRDAVSQAASGRVDVTRSVGVVGWEPPAGGVLKCNVDAAWFEQDGATGYTAVVRDCTVLVIKVFIGI